ncbi:uncharacterized protein [Diadema antillarum]|uniref:uncharacterized protein n=1 Tax=Diadema antillarum TaxID=105358 RepID=UPI003A8560FB
MTNIGAIYFIKASAGVTQPSATSSPSSSTASSSTPATTGESNPEPPHGCDRTITADRGQITSPNYPLKVTDFPRCRITIVAPSGFAPVIVFPEFEFMGSSDCSTGETFVQINAIEDHPELVCGSQKPFSVTADGNVVVVDTFGTPDSFHWFSASFHSRSTVNVHFIMYEGVIGRFDANALEPSASGADGAHTALLLHAHPGARVNVGFEEVLTDVDQPIRQIKLQYQEF